MITMTACFCMYIGTILLLSLASALAKEANEVRSRFVTIVGPNFCVIGCFSPDPLFHRQVQYLRRAPQSSGRDIECIPLLRVTQYEPGSYHPGPHSEWNCQLLQSTPAARGRSGKIIKLEDIYNLPEGTVQKFKSGGSVLKISGAQVSSDRIKIPQGAAATIKETDALSDNGLPNNIFAMGASSAEAAMLIRKFLSFE